MGFFAKNQLAHADIGLSGSPAVLTLTGNAGKDSRRRRWTAVLFWGIFAAGLVVQWFAPRLQISNNTFIMPFTLTPGGKAVSPIGIVARERRMQALSAILTACGAFGLAFSYRRSLVKARRH